MRDAGSLCVGSAKVRENKLEAGAEMRQQNRKSPSLRIVSVPVKGKTASPRNLHPGWRKFLALDVICRFMTGAPTL